MASTSTPDVAVVLTEELRAELFARDVREGLSATHKHLPSAWLYDERGSELFERITELPEYYPTRTERAILESSAPEVAGACRAASLVELGSGSSTKTRLLIEALHRLGTLRHFSAFDVAGPTMRAALSTLAADYPCVEVSGVVGDFERHLGSLPTLEDRTVVFLGSTIGNLDQEGRKAFLAELSSILVPGEHLLLGVDLVKDPARLIAAYDDPGGVTEAFEKNALVVVNRAFGAAFDPDRFAYRAVWSELDERIEMGLVSRGDQDVPVPGLGLVARLVDGEEIRTEISVKFRLDRLTAELGDVGLRPVGSWSDPAGDFAVVLARREAP